MGVGRDACPDIKRGKLLGEFKPDLGHSDIGQLFSSAESTEHIRKTSQSKLLCKKSKSSSRLKLGKTG